MAQNKPSQLSVIPTNKRPNPLEAAVREFDALQSEHSALYAMHEELKTALTEEQQDHSATRGLHVQDTARMSEDYSRLEFKLNFLLEEHATLERRCEFYRRKAEMLTGKLQLLSTAAAASYNQAIAELYEDRDTADKAPLPEDEAATHKAEETELADLVSRLPQSKEN